MERVLIASFVSAVYSWERYNRYRHPRRANEIAPIVHGPYRSRASALRALRRMKFHLNKRGQVAFEKPGSGDWDEAAIIIPIEKFREVIREEAGKVRAVW